MHRLESLGWTPAHEAAFAPHRAAGLVPGRVIEEQRELWTVALAEREVVAEPTGRLRHEARDRRDLPAVGDWVALAAPAAGSRARLRALLPRRNALVRKAAGRTTEAQVLAANVDTVLVATSVGADFSPRRLERYLAFVWESGAQPVVLLTKADLARDLPGRVAEAEACAPGAPVVAVSALTGDGVDGLVGYLPPARTGILVGSSGVGKSTLVNRLLGAGAQRTQAVRESDERGVHTTTSRRLVVLGHGGLLIDTPGLRELALLDDEGLDAAFADVEALARRCRFRDCAHASEPGCAVRGAVEEGALGEERLEGYLHLQREIAYLARKEDVRALLAERRRWRQVSRDARRRRDA